MGVRARASLPEARTSVPNERCQTRSLGSAAAPEASPSSVAVHPHTAPFWALVDDALERIGEVEP